MAREKTTFDTVAQAPKAELPQPLLDELANWARQYALETAAPARAALARVESDLETLEAERDALALARDEAQAAIAERDDIIERLNAELRDGKQVAMDALVSKAKDQLAIDGKEHHLAALRAEVERHLAAPAAESNARLRAEMELVGATTARDSFAAEAKELRTQLDAARSERGRRRGGAALCYGEPAAASTMACVRHHGKTAAGPEPATKAAHSL